MGVVLPDIPDRLTGPAVDADMGAFQAAFGGAPEAGALATLRRLDHRAVYGDQLYRVPVAGFAGANRMETDLDLGGNDLTGASAMEADTLALESDLTVGGRSHGDRGSHGGPRTERLGSGGGGGRGHGAERAGGGRGIGRLGLRS